MTDKRDVSTTELVADSEALPVLRTHVSLPLRLRNWSGWPRGEGHGERQHRLRIRNADGEAVGFVLNSQHLYLEPGWEPVRSEIVDALQVPGVAMAAVPEGGLPELEGEPWLYVWPTDKRLHIYKACPGSDQGSDLVAVFHIQSGKLDAVDKRYRRPANRLLQRMGVIGPGERCAYYSGTKDRPKLANSTVLNAPPPRGEGPAARQALLKQFFALFQRALNTPPAPALPVAGYSSSGTKETAWALKVRIRTSSSCAFPAVEILPVELQPRVSEWLDLVHTARHNYDRSLREASGVPVNQSERKSWQTSTKHHQFPTVQGMKNWRVSLDWPEGMDLWVDTLIDRHNSHYAIVAGHRARSRYPDLWDQARVQWEKRGALRMPAAFGVGFNLDESSIAHFLAQALRRETDRRRTWDEVEQAPCPVCGERFNPRSSAGALVIAWGANRWCRPCTSAPYKSANDATLSRWAPAITEQDALEAIRFMATLQPFPRMEMPKRPQTEDMPPELANAWLLARIAMPAPDELRSLGIERSWTGWLQAAGVVGDQVRLSRGTAATAKDGHPCRSLFELAIDDFFHANGIAHEAEPVYPWHQTLNLSGTRRADWLLPGRVVVEAAGMVSDEYFAKLTEKQHLAHLAGFQVITVYPEQLHDLHGLFLAHVQGPLAGAAIHERLPASIG